MKDITQIRVGKVKVGIVGLKAALEETTGDNTKRSDEEIRSWLLEILSKPNYIPPGLRNEYSEAFLQAYKKHIGDSSAESTSDELQVKVLGQGCMRCDRLEQDVRAVMSENNITGDLEHVRDLEEINSFGVMGTPALVINGEVKAVGKVPSKSRIKTWLCEVGVK